jgi:hypothetical protein
VEVEKREQAKKPACQHSLCAEIAASKGGQGFEKTRNAGRPTQR